LSQVYCRLHSKPYPHICKSNMANFLLIQPIPDCRDKFVFQTPTLNDIQWFCDTKEHLFQYYSNTEVWSSCNQTTEKNADCRREMIDFNFLLIQPIPDCRDKFVFQTPTLNDIQWLVPPGLAISGSYGTVVVKFI
jgi:hypothetical protein